MIPLVGFDFETKIIGARPAYPPKPVGFGVVEARGRKLSKRSYFAVSHPTKNNTTPSQALDRARDLWKAAARREIKLVFFNSKFDLDVAETHLGLPPLPWDCWEDPMFLAFLDDPYEKNLGLKQMAVKHLSSKHEAQNKLREWIVENVPEARRSKTNWGAYISEAPGDLVAPYANDDTAETVQLFRVFAEKHLGDDGMRAAYEREKRLVYPLLRAERRGVRINEERLAHDVKKWERSLDLIDDWLRKKLRSPGFDVDSPDELRAALEKADVMEEWLFTPPSKTYPGGQKSAAVESLELGLAKQPELLNAFRYRAKLANGLRTFGRPWLEMAAASGDSRIFTQWNQVRQDKTDRRQIGARTGRLSSTPNFQNIAKTPGIVTFDRKTYERELAIAKKEDSAKPLALSSKLKGVAPLPDLRAYVVPYRRGYEINVRDFAQQELRILAHFEGGKMMEAYINNPRLDQHDYARDMINSTLGTSYTRKHIKNTGFGIIYAMGLQLLSETIETDVETARAVRDAYRKIFPGLDELEKALKKFGRRGQPIRTHGGRIYYPEEAKMIRGQMKTFEYKLINTLIQGSAGDAMKETIIAYDETEEMFGSGGSWNLTVHDELVTSAPAKMRKVEQERIRLAMTAMKFDVPMLSDGAYGPTWSARDLIKFKEAA